MEILSRFISAVRRKGLLAALAGGFRRVLGQYKDYKIRRWYRKAHASNEQFDRRYGVETSTIVEVDAIDVSASGKVDSTRFESIYEHLFQAAFAHVRIDHSRFVFVDFGSGKGKALLLASRYPFKKIIGVEFSADLCRACERNLAIFASPSQKTRAFEVICIDAGQYEPPLEPAVFFFFNPFRGTLMQNVINNLASSLRKLPRPAWIVYCNPDWSSYIDATGLFEQVAARRRFRVYRTSDAALRAANLSPQRESELVRN